MGALDQQVMQTIEEVNELASCEMKYTGFCIGSTRKKDSKGSFFSPIRNTRQLIAGSIIVYSFEEARDVAFQVDGKVDYVLVDCERKFTATAFEDSGSKDLESVVRAVVKSSKVLAYKGNDLTVDSLESQILQFFSNRSETLSNKKATIIGAGNIGSKLALKLVERGLEVSIARRDKKKLDVIVTALNCIKTPETMSKITGQTDNLVAAIGADLLIALSSGNPVITASMLQIVAPGALLIDGGKGCFSADAVLFARKQNMPIYRGDFRLGFEGYIGRALEAESMTQSLGRKQIKGVSIVSVGLLANEDEVVVDDINFPKVVFGLSSGLGDFVRQCNGKQSELVQLVQDYIDNENSKL